MDSETVSENKTEETPLGGSHVPVAISILTTDKPKRKQRRPPKRAIVKIFEKEETDA
tara:strand:+ start:278 stop:448 length:171 start_codon:yes stop_codon:yes gene_type:complete